jgi:hypothetical protein
LADSAGGTLRGTTAIYDGDWHLHARRREPTVPRPPDRLAQSPGPDRPVAADVPAERRDLPAADATDRLAVGREPDRWSKADLRKRLERLPPGHPSSVSGDEPDANERHDPRLADEPKRDYWSEVPRFSRAWADHVRSWPAERLATEVDRSKDPAGSWRGDGNQYLDPEQQAQANEVIASVARTEKKITEHMKQVERDNACDGWLEGLPHRLKGEERLKEKIAEKIQHEPDRTPTEAGREINDAIRYTFCFEQSVYASGYWDIKQRLESSGYRMIYSENHWRGDPEYKGINSRWVTPESQRFEVQFHTAESYHAKQHVTHSAYERDRNPLTRRSERREIEAFQQDVCAFIAVPDDAYKIPDYKEEDS